jgi:serine/threonine protein kinase
MDAVGLAGAAPATIADYQVIRVLGEGNNGRFYLARPPARLGLPDEYVAVKVFTGSHSEQAYERGVRELRAFAQVTSPYLVRVYDAVLQDSFLYAMEYCPLGSLAAPARPLSRGEVLRAVANAAHALHALHEAGLTHGDLKPANILLTEEGGKLSDLGLARFLTPGVTLTGMASAASVEFLDPALLRGDRPSRATEVFALGATLHRALTGNGLYGELPDSEPLLAIRRVMSAEPALAPGLTNEEAALVVRAQSAMKSLFSAVVHQSQRVEIPASPPLSRETTPTAPTSSWVQYRTVSWSLALTKTATKPPVAVSPSPVVYACQPCCSGTSPRVATSGRASPPSPPSTRSLRKTSSAASPSSYR